MDSRLLMYNVLCLSFHTSLDSMQSVFNIMVLKSCWSWLQVLASMNLSLLAWAPQILNFISLKFMNWTSKLIMILSFLLTMITLFYKLDKLHKFLKENNTQHIEINKITLWDRWILSFSLNYCILILFLHSTLVELIMFNYLDQQWYSILLLMIWVAISHSMQIHLLSVLDIQLLYALWIFKFNIFLIP